MKNVFRLGIICVLLLSGCSGCKDKEENYPAYPITDQRLIDAVNFQKGSYFVYQDSVTAEVDSFWVDNYAHSYIRNDVQHKSFESAVYSGFAAITLQTSISIGAGTGAQDRVSLSYWYNGNPYALGAVLFRLPFVEGFNGTNYTCVKFYNQYNNGINTYPNVYEMNSAVDFHSYYSLDSGLVKFSLNAGGLYHTWRLIRQKTMRN